MLASNEGNMDDGEEQLPTPVSTEKSRRGRGRPKGSKDAFPRYRRSKLSLHSIPNLDANDLESESVIQQSGDLLQPSTDADNDDLENANGEERQNVTIKVGGKRARTAAGRKKDLSAQQARRKKMKQVDNEALIEEENALHDPKWLKSTVQGFSLSLFRTLNYAEGSVRRGFLNQNQPLQAALTRTAIIQMHRMIIEMSRPPRNDVEVQPAQVEDVIQALINVLHRRFNKPERSSSQNDNGLELDAENDDNGDEEDMLGLVDEGVNDDTNGDVTEMI
jgi:hypothetical protein